MTRPLIVFSDLDGTLLSAKDYSWREALPALERLKRNSIPLILTTSKTRAEIEQLRRELGNHHPFISENGGGIYIPGDYFDYTIVQFLGPRVPPPQEVDDLLLIRLGAPYAVLRAELEKLRREGFACRGFGDMTDREVSELTGLSVEEARLARRREFDEPFVYTGDRKEELKEAMRKAGFLYTEGEFFHLMGLSDKGRAVSILRNCYERHYGSQPLTVGLGDSPNDLPMLCIVERPFAVRKPTGRIHPLFENRNIADAGDVGPVGWREAVTKVLDEEGVPA